MIRCVRCGREDHRGRLNAELHRVLYLCDNLCPACADELHEWWMLPPGAELRAQSFPMTFRDEMRPPVAKRRQRARGR